MIHVVCLGFNRPEMVEGALKNFAETEGPWDPLRVRPILFDCGYPLPDPASNRQAMYELAARYGWECYSIENKGVAENHNQAIFDVIKPDAGDFYVTFDPDVRMQQPGWLEAMAKVLIYEPNAVFCCASRPFHDEQWCWSHHGREVINGPLGIRYAKWRELIAWSMGMYKAWWLTDYAGRNFAADNPVYGYGEHAMVRLMGHHGKSWISLVDYYDHHLGATDDLYTKWKLASAEKKTDARFEEWLAPYLVTQA